MQAAHSVYAGLVTQHGTLIAAAANGSATHEPITYFQAVVLGLLQGLTELFPISSLGHTVLFPTLFGWTPLVNAQSDPESFWLAFVVMLHVGSALGLLAYYWQDWVRLVRAWFSTLRKRRVETGDEKMIWLLIVATIPTGILGLALEHAVRVALAKPMAGACFLIVNGVMLLAAERLRRRGRRRASSVSYVESFAIGVAQGGALIPGMSRDGICMTAGLLRGLRHDEAARFAFLLATPIILAAGIVKFGDLTGPLGAGIRVQSVVAAVCSAVTSLLSVAFLVRYFKRWTLRPFGLYCCAFGTAMVVYLLVR